MMPSGFGSRFSIRIILKQKTKRNNYHIRFISQKSSSFGVNKLALHSSGGNFYLVGVTMMSTVRSWEEKSRSGSNSNKLCQFDYVIKNVDFFLFFEKKTTKIEVLLFQQCVNVKNNYCIWVLNRTVWLAEFNYVLLHYWYNFFFSGNTEIFNSPFSWKSQNLRNAYPAGVPPRRPEHRERSWRRSCRGRRRDGVTPPSKTRDRWSLRLSRCDDPWCRLRRTRRRLDRFWVW